MKDEVLWELTLRKVRPSDAGVYECQLTTHPPVSLFFNLRVVEAQAVIKGPKELHVHEGSKLRLHCTVEDATEPLLYVFWFHNTTMVNHHPDRPIQVSTKRYSSTLSIANVRRTDAGQYRCEPHLAIPANVTIHVLAGENPAAMQRGRDGIADRETPVSETSDGIPPTNSGSGHSLQALPLAAASATATFFFQKFFLSKNFGQGLILIALSWFHSSSMTARQCSASSCPTVPPSPLISDRSGR
ncbi:Immunoglobulin-like domain [Trinorchestia longiramus]|nr:Immunoglobulin-like domain [Trinorchestia longiramus]